jgi:hypothetical protein
MPSEPSFLPQHICTWSIEIAGSRLASNDYNVLQPTASNEILRSGLSEAGAG